jgi:hypothetical protein
MKKKFNIKLTVAVLSMVFLSTSAFAQNNNGNHNNGNQNNGNCNNDDNHDNQTSAPFDGGISLLAAAGIGYASKKAADKRKRQEEAKKF